MGAIKPHKTATIEDEPWDGPGEVAKAPNDEKTLRYMHAWVDDSGDPEAKNSYKFPHHAAGTDTPANINAVNDGLSRLTQAKIPEADRAGVEEHLRAHRRDAGLEDDNSSSSSDEKVREIRPRTYVPASLLTTPWAILPEKLAVLQGVFIRYMSGEKLDSEEIQMAIHGAKRPPDRKEGQIAILPLFGSIFPRANLMTSTSGATSAEIFGKQFDELINDPEVGAIILDVDSPGGQASGIPELSKKIFEARSKKPIVAVANHEMDSAAYYIGSAAGEVVITPSGELGSIGVYAAHDDISGALAQEGVKRTLISAGKYKVEGNPWEPLTEEAKATIQASVDEIYDQFVLDVARNRGAKPGDVRNGYGEGRPVGARQAIELGMADRIGTLEETIKRLGKLLIVRSEEGKQQAENLRIEVRKILEKEKEI